MAEKKEPGFIMTGHTKLYRGSLRNYVDYVRWQREELKNLLDRYRKQFPRQISAFKKSAYNSLSEQSPKMWQGMYANLNQRGLSDSGAFLGGAKQAHEDWDIGQRSDIESAAQGMETSAQQAILSALGKPNYAGVFTGAADIDRQIAEYLRYREDMDKAG